MVNVSHYIGNLYVVYVNMKFSRVNIRKNIMRCTPAHAERLSVYISRQLRDPSKKWVYDIINGRCETEKCIYEDTDITIVPDIDHYDVKFLALFKDISLHTIRNLDASHIEMLKRVNRVCRELAFKRFGSTDENTMCYFHYLPSVFQLHLHVSSSNNMTLDAYRVHPIENVISNLCIDSDYYRKASICISVHVSNIELMEVFQ